MPLPCSGHRQADDDDDDDFNVITAPKQVQDWCESMINVIPAGVIEVEEM